MRLIQIATALCLAAASQAQTASSTEESTRLDIQFGITGDGVCDLALEHTNDVRSIVAKNMKVGGQVLTDKDIVFYDVTGCNNRRRRKVLGASATVTIGFSTTTATSKGLDADGFYDAATESLKESISGITSEFEATCGCSINVDTIKVELSTLVDEEAPAAATLEAEAPAQRDLIGHDVTRNTGNQILASRLPSPAATYYAGGDCPNSCSGHGACSVNGCVCWPNWGNGDNSGGACDQRICPYEIAWVDTPSSANKAHALAECAGRGICDRTTGDCQCFPGYEGKGCRRTTCPNGCSGHGQCKYLREFRNDVGDDFKYTGNRPSTDQYAFEFALLWDAGKTRGCVCDPKWRGVDCSIRMCPRGDYPQYFALEKRAEVQAIVIRDVFTPGTDRCHGDPTVNDANFYKYRYGVGAGGDNYPRGNNGIRRSNSGGRAVSQADDCDFRSNNGEFALTFRSTLGEEFTTKTLDVYNVTEEVVYEALNSLPNKVIQDASVTVFRNMTKAKWMSMWNATHLSTQGHSKNDPHVFPYSPEFNYTWYSNDLVILVSYDGAMTTGDQYALECKTQYCGAGCQPLMEHPLDFKVGPTYEDGKHSACSVLNNFVPAIATNWECSGRGDCDEKGVCQCYQGYTDEYCSTRTAII